MPQIALVAASLWDLRAQCEQQLRLLTDAQRLTEEYRDHPAQQGLLKRRLRADLALLLQANATIRDVAQECAAGIDRLPAPAGEGV